jgi:TonB family protein
MTEITSLAAVWAGILDHLWQAGLVALPVVLVVRWAHQAPAGWLHALSLLGIVKLTLPLVVLGGWVSRLLEAWVGPEPLGGWAVVAATLAAPGLAGSTGGDRWLAAGVRNGALLALTALALALVARESVRLVRRFRAAQRLSASVSRTLTAGHALRTEKLDQVIRETGIPAEQVILMAAPSAPCVVGWWHPRILIPREVVEELDRESLRAILLHEDVHRRRRDPLRSLVAQSVTAPLAFVPFRGALLRAFAQTIELVCDDETLRRGASPNAYERAIVHVARRGLVHTGAVPGLAGGAAIGARLSRIHGERKVSLMKTHKLALVAVAGMVAVLSFSPVAFLLSCSRQEPGNPEPVASSSGERAEFDVPPALLVPPNVQYPDEARAAGVTGTVFLEVHVDAGGRVASVSVKRSEGIDSAGTPLAAEDAGLRALEVAAGAAMEGLRFEAATRDGSPVSATVVLPIQFKLS